MITGDQLFAHLIGDYILQSHWMATEKTKRAWPALVHSILYTLPFLFITTSPVALGIIAGSHFVIDRWRLARYVIWLKNQLGPEWISWSQCKSTGYPNSVNPWLSTWLLIIADNTLHIGLNGLAIYLT